MKKNEIQRLKIAEQTETFLASGGQITQHTAFDNAGAGFEPKRNRKQIVKEINRKAWARRNDKKGLDKS